MGSSLLSRLWSSPTAMLMASMGVQSLVQIALLPLILWRFDAPTVALWALFGSIGTIMNTAAQTITATCVRAVAFAAAGARDLADIAEGKKTSEPREANRELLAEVVAGARTSFALLALVVLAVLATAGTLLVERIVATTSDPGGAWLAWSIVLVSTTIVMYGNFFVGYLEGHNHVALTRRWDAIFTLLGAASSATALIASGELVVLVASAQAWMALRVVRNWLLARRVEDGELARLPRRPALPAVRALWPAFWRSFLGVALILGVNHAGGVFYAQFGEPRAVAIYLLAIRLFDALSAVARAPFYARIPALARMYAQGKTEEQLADARKGMRLAYWIFVAGLLGAAALGPAIFEALGSDVPFPPGPLWLLLGTALLLERYGAMHLQLFSTTNQIVWHTAAAGYAVVYFTAIAAFGRELGVYVFPVAMALGYAGWYSWYTARRSYRAFGLDFWSFERTLFIPPFLITVAALCASWMLR